MKLPVRNLVENKVSKKSQIYLIVDFITKLLLIVEKNAILVTYDKLLKIIYFVATTKEILAEKLARLSGDNIQKIHELQESIISNKEPQFVADLTKKLNQILGIKTRLLTVFHLKTNEQIERINQKLEQYLKFFIDYRQKDQSE